MSPFCSPPPTLLASCHPWQTSQSSPPQRVSSVHFFRFDKVLSFCWASHLHNSMLTLFIMVWFFFFTPLFPPTHSSLPSQCRAPLSFRLAPDKFPMPLHFFLPRRGVTKKAFFFPFPLVPTARASVPRLLPPHTVNGLVKAQSSIGFPVAPLFSGAPLIYPHSSLSSLPLESVTPPSRRLLTSPSFLPLFRSPLSPNNPRVQNLATPLV